MKYQLIVFVLFLGVLFGGRGQEDATIDSLLVFDKHYKVDKLEQCLKGVEDNVLKKLLVNHVHYLREGKKPPVYNLEVLEPLAPRQRSLAQCLIAESLALNESGKDSLVFQLYKGAFEMAKNQRDTLMVNSVLKRLNWHLFRNSYELNTFRKYIGESQVYVKDSIDGFYLQYYRIGLALLAIDEEGKTIDIPWFTNAFSKGYRAANVPYLVALLLQLQGIYHAAYLNDFDKGVHFYKRAIESYQRDSNYLSKKGVRSVRFNIGVELYNQGNFKEAIPYFKADLENQDNRLYRMYGYDWLYKSYDGLKQYDSAYFYFKKMTETKDKLDRLSHARDIKRIEKEYDLTKKERELKELSEKNKKLQNQFMGLIPILGTILVVLAIIYFLYKRYKRKSTKLEEEKSETLQKLDELKSIVTKNHIVLRDKTKVYIADLIYIKADDHYLNIFTSNDKNHYVRGKLKQIKEELPPNFIQCHRSYIVNSNFVKQVNNDALVLMNKERIPLSRTFKGKFT